MRPARLLLGVCLLVALLSETATAHLEDDIVLGEDPRKPIAMDAELLCHACHAAVIEMVKYVDSRLHTKPWSEAVALSFLDELCTIPHLKSYEFIPPKMVRGCLEYLNMHGDEFEDALAVGGTHQALRARLCDPLCLPFDVHFVHPDVVRQRLEAAQADRDELMPKQGKARKLNKDPARAQAKARKLSRPTPYVSPTPALDHSAEL